MLLGKDLKREKSKKKVDGGKRNMGKKKEIDSEVETDGKDMADAEDRGTPIVEDNQVAKRSSYDPQSDEDGPSTLVHESLKSRPAKSKSHSGARTKYIPAGETQQQRDARTIFVGNLPVEVAQKRVNVSFFFTSFRCVYNMPSDCSQATPTPYSRTSPLC